MTPTRINGIDNRRIDGIVNHMKIKCTVTLDIDPDAYTDEYGVEGAAAIRTDLQRHIQDSITAHFESIGVLR